MRVVMAPSVNEVTREKGRKLRSAILYAVVLLFYYMTGSAFLANGYSLKVIGTFFFILVSVLLTGAQHGRRSLEATAALLLLIAFVLLTFILSGDSNTGPYIAIPLILLSGYFACYLGTFEEFSDRFINTIAVFGGASLVMSGLASAFPTFPKFFPLVVGEFEDYRNAGFHVYISLRGYNLQETILQRNAGISWEPGAYQAFLNLALYLLLYRRHRGLLTARDGWRFVLLSLAVLSTFSTTGVGILVLLLFSFRRTIGIMLAHSLRGVRFLTFPLSLTLMFAMLQVTSFNFFAKASGELESDASVALRRVAFDRLHYLWANESQFLGSGFSSWESTGLSLWNSVIHTGIVLGIPFTGLLILLYLNFAWRFQGHRLVLIAVLFGGFATEPLFWRWLFVYLAFSGLVHFNGRAPYTSSSSSV